MAKSTTYCPLPLLYYILYPGRLLIQGNQQDYERLIFSSLSATFKITHRFSSLPGSFFIHKWVTHSLKVVWVGKSKALRELRDIWANNSCIYGLKQLVFKTKKYTNRPLLPEPSYPKIENILPS